MIEGDVDLISRRLEEFRRSLLDTSMRNRLINFRTQTAKGKSLERVIPIVGEDPNELIRILVTESRAMSFQGKPDPKKPKDLEHVEEIDDFGDEVSLHNLRIEAEHELDTFLQSGSEITDQLDFKLNTGETVTALDRKLTKISRDAKVALEEQGVNILFLALGSLEWYEADHSNELRRAPLILVPVVFSDRIRTGAFRVKWDGSELGANLSLGALLRREEHGIKLPELPEEVNAKEYFSAVEKAITRKPRWKVDKEAVALAFFSYAKYLMYRDLDQATWPTDDKPSHHRVLGALLDNGFEENEPGISEDQNLDHLRTSDEICEVYDADSSQTLAILESNSGRSMVIEGPPGTGKSQTITNLIAEAIGAGKRVLFIAEKAAALDVVFRRLKEAHLEEACLELHSNKASKKSFYSELNRTVKVSAPRVAQVQTEIRRLEDAKNSLNTYSNAINAPLSTREISPRFAMGQLINLGAENSNAGRHDFSNMNGWSQTVFVQRSEIVGKLQSQVARMGRPIDHPYFGCTLDHLLPQDKADIGVSLAHATEKTEQFHIQANNLAEALRVELPVRPADTNILQSCVNFISKAPDVAGVNLLEQAWEDNASSLECNLRKGNRLSEVKAKLAESSPPDISSRDISGLRDILYLKPLVTEAFDSKSSSDLDECLKLLDILDAQCCEHRANIKSLIRDLQVGEPLTLWAVAPITTLAKHLANGPSVAGMAVSDETWSTSSDLLRECLDAVRRIQANKSSHSQRLTETSWTADVRLELDVLVRTSNSFFKFLNGSYRRAMRSSTSYFKEASKSPIDRIQSLQAIVETQQAEQFLASNRGKCSSLLGERWQGSRSNATELLECVSWIEDLHESVRAGKTPKTILALLEQEIDHVALSQKSDEVRESSIKVSNSIVALRDAIKSCGHSQLEEATGDASERVYAFVTQILHPHKNALRALLVDAQDFGYGGLREIVDFIRELQEIRSDLHSSASLMETYLGRKWLGEETSWFKAVEIVNWVLTLKKSVNDGDLPTGIITFFADELPRSGLEEAVSVTQASRQIAQEAVRKVLSQAQLHDDPSSFVEEPIAWQRDRLANWSQRLDDLPELIRYNSIAEEGRRQGLSESVELADSWPEASSELGNAFARAWFTGVLREAISQRPEIARFDRASHEQLITEFRQLDDFLLSYNRAKVALAHWRSVPRGVAGGAMGWLMTQFNLSRSHKPIRVAMEKAGAAVQAIKPVFLMSPLSVAMYLPTDGPRFDLVIFDEASQVKPEDAFGGIIRANQTIVVGDSKQMPPTSFFDTVTSDGGDDDEEEETDDLGQSMKELESILAMMNSKIPVNSPRRRDLRWHYRSKHDALIATSNRLYYDDRLIVFPNPWREGNHGGLLLRHDPTTVYGRGGTRKNVEEARAVAKAAYRHVIERPHLSLGIAAFSKAQQEAINDELELLKKQDPAFQHFDSHHQFEPLFVKNLENIQGDERDVILISVGYGRDESGFVTASFGPLNRDGGERRLNVLISRARVRCEVFSNIKSADVRLSERPAKGVVGLKTFLAFADTGSLDVPAATGQEPQSPFEESVLDKLRNAGFDVDPQVGSCGFYIDLAVKHPEQPQKYVLGIECDGAMYHSARSARDRDKLRQSVLESRGWRIHRIWSTDWFNNPDRELERLHKAIALAIDLSTDDQEYSGASESTNDYKPLERSEHEVMVEQPAIPYSLCDLDVQLNGYLLHEIPTYEMASWVTEVVRHESPVHFYEVVRRIREAADVGKAGSRIMSAVELATEYAENKGMINWKEEFLFDPNQELTPVRSRAELPPQSKKLEYVSVEEIAQAMVNVVGNAYGIEKTEAFTLTVRSLGFDRTTGQMLSRLDIALVHATTTGRLRISNGLLWLPS